VAGNPDPATEKPGPLAVTALTVRGTSPADDNVTVCVAGVFTFTLPNARLAVLTFSVGVATLNCRINVSEIPPAAAVMVAVCAVATAPIEAVKLAVNEPPGTVIAAGVVTAALLLVRLAVKPPLAAAALRVTVQESAPAPVIEPLEHINWLRIGTPLPLRLMAVEGPFEELL
jgi:hypothetical protein